VGTGATGAASGVATPGAGERGATRFTGGWGAGVPRPRSFSTTGFGAGVATGRVVVVGSGRDVVGAGVPAGAGVVGVAPRRRTLPGPG
jgi:hypothetical protein